ncbi:MAG TPA: hypothetical protein PLB89_09440 [Flavobacteriales bacterium]|nr:hypothetical protein [Flavobacteriales bacterium]
MQNVVPVQLSQVRDFGQLISTTFVFLKQNWKPLARAIAVVCLPFAVIGGFLSGGTMAGFQELQLTQPDDPFAALNALGTGMLFAIPGFLLLMFGYLLLISMVHEYLRAYHLGEHHMMTPGELAKRGWSQMGSYFGAGFLMGLIIVVGFVLCILPGLYAWTVLSLSMMAHAIERTGGSGSLGRSNNLVKADFWPTLGLLIVIGLISGMLNFIIQLPFTIVGMVVGFNTALETAQGNVPGFPTWYGTFMSIATAIQWCGQMLLYPIMAVCMGLKYFSRVEETEGLGLRRKMQGFEQA